MRKFNRKSITTTDGQTECCSLTFVVDEEITLDASVGIQGKADQIIRMIGIGNRALIGITILVAAARDDFGEPEEWMDWAKTLLMANNAHIHHLCQVGNLMIREAANRKVIEQLSALDYRKLMSLSRLESYALRNILDKYDLTKKSRDEVRAIVNRLLGEEQEPAKEERKQIAPATIQLDFFSSLAGTAAKEWKNESEVKAAAEAAGSAVVVSAAHNSMWMLETLAKSGKLELNREARIATADACIELANLLKKK
jgi:hypothetical protein